MKQTILLIVLSNCLLDCYCQNKIAGNVKAESNLEVQIRITNWKGILVLFSPKAFDNDKEDIIGQIGEVQFNEVMRKGQPNSWPGKERFYDPRVDGYDKRLNRLKLYKIASFNHVNSKGKHFGSYLILKVPYNENANWDKEIQWEGNIYIIIPEKFTAIVN